MKIDGFPHDAPHVDLSHLLVVTTDDGRDYVQILKYYYYY